MFSTRIWGGPASRLNLIVPLICVASVFVTFAVTTVAVLAVIRNEAWMTSPEQVPPNVSGGSARDAECAGAVGADLDQVVRPAPSTDEVPYVDCGRRAGRPGLV